MKSIKFLCLLVFFSLSPWLRADDIKDDPAKELQTKLNALQKMSASFKQKIDAGKRRISNSSGTMAIYRPGRLRWDTQEPMTQLIVADGSNLWIYDQDLEQVTVKKQDKELGGTPGLFLSGYDNTVARDFTVIKESKGDLESFQLHAKSPKENYQKVILSFKAGHLSTLEFFDQLGQHSTITLSKMRENEDLSPRLFQFKPPKGVDLVRQ